MLRFFRQFRKQLIMENRSRKYLFYMLGEVVIVIMGILIALQVDNWNQQRQERGEAHVFLVRLKNEFLSNREQMVQKIAMREQALGATRVLLRFIDGPPGMLTDRQVDSLLALAMPVYTFDPSQGVLNQLTSTDKLILLQSEALNDKLSNWNSMMQDFKEDENMYNSYNHNQFRPFIYRNYNGRDIINARIRNRVINPILLADPELVNREIGFSGHAANTEFLRRSREFESHLAFMVSWLSLINTQSEGVLQYIDGVLDIIDEELNPS